MSFADGMRMGMQIWDSAEEAKRLKKIEDRAEQQRLELEKIGNAQPEQSQGFTPDQGDQVRAAAESGQYDVGYDEASKSYTINPKADPSQTGRIGMQGVTDFNGQRTAGAMSESQVANSRQRAMAGVVMKSDPVQGMRMMRDVTQGERDDQRFGWEKDRNERDLRKASEDDDFQKGLQAEYGNSIFAKKMGGFAPELQAYQQADAQYKARLQAGETPATIGPAPQAPKRPDYSLAESLADNGRLLAFKATKGKADPTELMKYAETFKKVSDEGYGQALKLAQSGAPLAKVAETFNQSGSVKFDPAAVVSDQMVKGADGVPSRVIKFKDEAGQVHTINALSELDSIGQAESYFNRFFKGEDNRRGNEAGMRAGAQLGLAQNADKRAQTIFDTEAPVHEANAAIAQLKIDLAKTEDPAEQARLSEKISALASGRRGAGAQHDPADLIKANALVKNGIYPSQGEALDAIVSKPDKLYQTYKDSAMKVTMNADASIESAKKMMADDGWVKSSGGTWKRSGGAAAAPAAGATFSSTQDLEAAAKAGKIKSGDRVIVNGKAGTWK